MKQTMTLSKDCKKKNTIHIAYFTCGTDFDYLFVSLKSLLKLHSVFLGTIYLYIDKGNLLTKAQIDSLDNLKIKLKIRKYERTTTCPGGRGKQTVLSELQAFKEISEENSPEDYMAKVDSDVIFLSDRIFLEVLNSNDLLVGQEEDSWKPFTYTQGGCYFIKNSLVPELMDFNETIFSEVLKKINKIAEREYSGEDNCPEDAAIYAIAKSKTNKISFKEFFGSPNALRYSWIQRKASVIHFQGCKYRMLEASYLWIIRGMLRYAKRLIIKLASSIGNGVSKCRKA